MARLQVQGHGDGVGAVVVAGHHALQGQVQENIVDSGLGDHQLLGVLVIAHAWRQSHTCQPRLAPPLHRTFGQLCCGRGRRVSEQVCRAGGRGAEPWERGAALRERQTWGGFCAKDQGTRRRKRVSEGSGA